MDATKVNNAYLVAQQKLIVDQQQKWDQLINGLISKAGAPGLGMTQTGVISFDPMTFLFAAIEQSQQFGNIMATVTQIVQVFAEMLQALAPVIDALLDVVKAVANVFIFLYNMVARILDLFGLQIQQLNYLNSAIGGLIPLIQIWHEIPTLNELAAGKLNSPLSTTPQGYGALPGTQGAGQNMLMKVVEVLTAIFGAVVVEKMFSGLNLQQAVHATAQLIGLNAGQTRASGQAQASAMQLNQTTISAAMKQSGLGMTTNSLLTQILATLQQMAMASSQGGGFLSMLLGLGGAAVGIPGLGGIAGGGSSGFGLGGGGKAMSMPGGGGAAAAALQTATQAITTAAQRMQQAFSDNTRGILANTRAFGSLTQKMASFEAVLQSAGRAAALGSGNLSTALGMDMDRRINSTGYNINRVPM